ncbi:MAG: hypothetical protein ACO1SV_08000 [Fimbriimonas sp.]
MGLKEESRVLISLTLPESERLLVALGTYAAVLEKILNHQAAGNEIPETSARQTGDLPVLEDLIARLSHLMHEQGWEPPDEK